MNIYLLRHGSTLANEKRLVCGSVDFPLSETGLKQAELACRRLNGIAFTRIYTSSLSRAKSTIDKLSRTVPVQVESEIVELDTGDASHLTFEELWEIDERYRSPWLYPYLRYPNGECFEDMVTRITAWFERTSREWARGEVILIVGHEGTLRSIFVKLFNLSISQYPVFPIGNCDYLHIRVGLDRNIHYNHVALSGQDENR